MSTYKHHILYVDEDSDSREFVAIFFGMDGYEVTAPDSFAEANLLLSGRIFDVYLLNENLPEGKGIELCSQIRSFDRNAPIIVCSADTREVTRQRALSAGAQAFITKPIEPLGLSRLIGDLILRAELQSLEAKAIEIDAIRHEIETRLLEANSMIAHAAELKRRVEERTLRMKAREAFFIYGGTNAAFERLWPETWSNEVVQKGFLDEPQT